MVQFPRRSHANELWEGVETELFKIKSEKRNSLAATSETTKTKQRNKRKSERGELFFQSSEKSQNVKINEMYREILKLYRGKMKL